MPERMSEDMPGKYARKNVIRYGIYWAAFLLMSLGNSGVCSWGFVLEHRIHWNAMVEITRSKVIKQVFNILNQLISIFVQNMFCTHVRSYKTRCHPIFLNLIRTDTWFHCTLRYKWLACVLSTSVLKFCLAVVLLSISEMMKETVTTATSHNLQVKVLQQAH